MSDGLKYEQPPRMSRREIEEAFLSGDGDRIGSALISALYTEDGASILDWCLRFIDHQQVVARYSVALVLGSLAILSGDEIDLPKCREAVEQLCRDPDEEVRTAARDALADVLRSIELQGAS